MLVSFMFFISNPVKKIKMYILVIFSLGLLFFSFADLTAAGWKSLGPLGGTPWSIAFSPSFEQDGIIFIGTNRGIYKSVDKGKSWRQSTKGIGRKLVPTIEISPNFKEDRTIFIGTSKGELFISQNAGEEWEMVFQGPELRSNSSMTSSSLEAISVSPNFSNDSTVFVGVFGGYIFRSTDGGFSWGQFKKGLDSKYVLALGISPNFSNDGTVFAGTIDKGVFVSSDRGETWKFTGEGLPDKFIQRIVVSSNYLNDQTVFLAMPGEGLFISRNQGKTWSRSIDGLDNDYVRTIDLSNNYLNDQTVFIGASFGMIFKSVDAGVSWTRVNESKSESIYGRNLQDKQIRSLALSPNFANDGVIFSGTSAGLFYSNDLGVTWEKVTEGLTVSTIRTLTISPGFANDGIVFAGTNNTGIFKSVNAGETWMQANLGLDNLKIWMIDVSPDFSNDGTVFATGKSGLYKSIDSGNSWTPWSRDYFKSVIQAVAISENFKEDSTVFVATTDGAFKSVNAGETWKNISENYFKSRILEIAISPDFSEDKTIFLGTLGDFIYKSINAGETWEKVYHAEHSNISVHSIDMSLNFSEDQLMIIGTNLGAFKSVNAGETWISMFEGLPVSHKMISSVKIASDGTMFVGLPNEGIFKSDDFGKSWDQINFGLFNDYVSVIDVSPNFSNDQIIYAGTLGSGVFRSSEFKAAPAPTPIPVPQTLYFSKESWNVLGYVFGILGLMVLILAVIYRKVLIRLLSSKKEISGNSTWNEIFNDASTKSDQDN
ncbi:MAG: WD40/YVTN/BNR-like repeat-containing protein [Dehalococcoidia bacterium]